MNEDVTTLERAFALARSGSCKTTGDLVRQLNSEGYDGRQVYGRSLLKQLNAMLRQARSTARHRSR